MIYPASEVQDLGEVLLDVGTLKNGGKNGSQDAPTNKNYGIPHGGMRFVI